MQDWPGLIEGYRRWLPVSDQTPVITLREGATPLIPAPVIAERIGKGVKVYLKYDGLNPTGSFKDRGMTMAISKAKEAGSEAVICASTGNTSAAAAAYARRGGMRAFVLIPDGYVAQGKLAQALVQGHGQWQAATSSLTGQWTWAWPGLQGQVSGLLAARDGQGQLQVDLQDAQRSLQWLQRWRAGQWPLAWHAA